MMPCIDRLILAGSFVFLTPMIARAADPQPILRIDPLMLVQAREVWSLIAQRDNPVWPGWNAADTPLLFYLPGVQDVLINHPKQPEGFRQYNGPAALPGFAIFVRDGKTFFEFDGQNTVTDVASVPTLVVADTLSNRRSNVRGWLLDPRPAEAKADELSWEQLLGSPYDTLTMIGHEAFHAFQRRQAPNKGGNELALTRYPALSPANNVGFALEAELLAAALKAKSPEEMKTYAMQWLAVRLDRRARIGDEAADYEDRMEFLEGLAKYVEWRMLEVLEGKTPHANMAWVQGFNGYTDLKSQRDRLIGQVVKMMSGQTNVNNDPYGASPVRMRLYFSGMGIAAILDRLDPGWKSKIFEPSVTLTSLMMSVLKPPGDDLAKSLQAVRARPDYSALQAKKLKLEQDGILATRQMLDSIESGPKTALIVDYSELEGQRPAMSFTPFGILRVDENRTIFRLIPMSAKIGDTRLRQTTAVPMLHDRAKKRFACQLQSVVKADDVARHFSMPAGTNEPVEIKKVELPGISLEGGRASVTVNDRSILVRLRK